MRFCVIFLLLVFCLVFVESEDNKQEEKDPWDKSTDKYWHNGGGISGSKQGDVDVTEETESEVHTQKSKVAKKKPKKKKEIGLLKDVDKETVEQFHEAEDEQDFVESPEESFSSNEHNPKITQKQRLSKKTHFNLHGDFYPGSLWQYPYPYFHPQYAPIAPCACKDKKEDKDDAEEDDDVSDELGVAVQPVDIIRKFPKKKTGKAKSRTNVPLFDSTEDDDEIQSQGIGALEAGYRIREQISKTPQMFFENYQPSSGWGGQPFPIQQQDNNEYQYRWIPYVQSRNKIHHGSRQLVPTHYYGPPTAGWGGFQPGKSGTGWGAPYWYKKRHHTHHAPRQLVPTHYYGPPSAGWGGFQPGKSGTGWGAPYWYKKRHHTHHAPRQLVPTHYYGPPSAGWGGFQPGKSGTGWGAPYWYKKRHHTHHAPRQLVPTHYYGPPSAGWGGFQPGKSGTGWGAPYWYKSRVANPRKAKHSKHEKASRKFVVAGEGGFGQAQQFNNGWDHGYGNGYGLRTGSVNINNKIFASQENTHPAVLAPEQYYTDNMPSGETNAAGGMNDALLTNNRQTAAMNGFTLNDIGINSRYSGNNEFNARPGDNKESLDFLAWHGPNSLGGKGWAANGWLGGMGGLDEAPQHPKKMLHSQLILPGQGIGIPTFGFAGGNNFGILGNRFNGISGLSGFDVGSKPLHKVLRAQSSFFKLTPDLFANEFKSRVPKKKFRAKKTHLAKRNISY